MTGTAAPAVREPADEPPDGPGALLRAAREVTLAQARTLARHGRYAEAEELLRASDPDAATLDLLARVHAQQGNLDEADRCWAEAERLAPGTAEFTAARARIAAIRGGGARGPVAAGTLARRVGVPLVALVMLALLVDIRFGTGDPEPAAAPVTVPASPSPSSSPSSAAAASAALDGLDLRVPGVRARRSPGEISVTFRRGLFRRDAVLSADGRAVLAALGARLRPAAGRLEVAVIGHTDPSPLRAGGDYAGNMELGMARATVAREVLREASGVPTARISVASLGGALPPYRGAGADAAARNRTVTVRISATGGG
ncbi:OmpA family protein [Actinomadura sp. NPDC047616]|uniref:OmpA family protein n=1 Tax=Actinomadura sp. NPDC047616 TaxID=3155914 RepID=UPI0033C8E3DD